MRHAPILEVRVAHAYHADGRCPEVALAPAAETEALLKNHRCLARYEAGAARVLAALSAAGAPMLPLPEGAALRFTIERKSADFTRITDLSALASTPAPLFTNRVMPAGATGELGLVSEAAPDAKRGADTVAAVEIVLHPGLLRTLPAAVFRVSFAARKARWVYYCVTDLPEGGPSLTVVDAAPQSAGAIRFDPRNRTRLDATPDAADPLGALLVQRNPGMRCYRFVSDDPVARADQPRRHLELRLDGDRLSGPLPNPPSEQVSTLTFKADDGSSSLVEAQAQIIRYVSRNLNTPT